MNHRATMKKFLYIFLTLILFSATYSCKSEEERQRISRAEKERLRKEDSAALKIGVLPTEDCLPILLAKELRLFDTLGIDVRLRKYHALSECRHALTRKLVEGAAIDSVLMKVINADSAIVYSALNTDLSWKFLTAKKARLTRLSQLTDKLIAADSHGMSHTLAEQAIDSLLKKQQMVFIVQVEDPAVRLSMLNTGNIDAALMPEPYASKAIKQGARWIKEVKEKPAGVIAFRTDIKNDTTRQRQQKMFLKAISIAKDSIAKYGKDNYNRLLEW